MDKHNYTKKFLDLLKDLKTQFPKRELSWHLAGMLAEYDANCWGVSDKELYYSLEKYSKRVEMDENPDDISRIIAEGYDLEALMAPSEDEYDDEI